MSITLVLIDQQTSAVALLATISQKFAITKIWTNIISDLTGCMKRAQGLCQFWDSSCGHAGGHFKSSFAGPAQVPLQPEFRELVVRSPRNRKFLRKKSTSQAFAEKRLLKVPHLLEEHRKSLRDSCHVNKFPQGLSHVGQSLLPLKMSLLGVNRT